MKKDKNKKPNKTAKNVAIWGVLIALAMVLSYLESFIPIGELVGLPGVKLGLANVVVLFALYSMKPIDAITIGVLRVLLSGFIFGASMLPYSLAGCVLSFLVMWGASKSKASIIGVSMLGGIAHNLGQLIVAAIITNTYSLLYSLYMPFLIIAGLVTGLLMGFAGKLVNDKLSKIVK